MNVKFFLKLIVSFIVIGAFSYYSNLFTNDDQVSLGSLIVSFPAVIIMAPFFLWHLVLKFNFPESNGYYLAAALFDIVLYSYLIERLVAIWKKWRAGKK